jgi:hypothetical protein
MSLFVWIGASSAVTVCFSDSHRCAWRRPTWTSEDKHELFRAARDAHRAADLLVALECHKSLDQALACLNEPRGYIVHQPICDSAQILHSMAESASRHQKWIFEVPCFTPNGPCPPFPFRFSHTMPDQKLVLVVSEATNRPNHGPKS